LIQVESVFQTNFEQRIHLDLKLSKRIFMPSE